MGRHPEPRGLAPLDARRRQRTSATISATSGVRRSPGSGSPAARLLVRATIFRGTGGRAVSRCRPVPVNQASGCQRVAGPRVPCVRGLPLVALLVAALLWPVVPRRPARCLGAEVPQACAAVILDCARPAAGPPCRTKRSSCRAPGARGLRANATTTPRPAAQTTTSHPQTPLRTRHHQTSTPAPAPVRSLVDDELPQRPRSRALGRGGADPLADRRAAEVVSARPIRSRSSRRRGSGGASEGTIKRCRRCVAGASPGSRWRGRSRRRSRASGVSGFGQLGVAVRRRDAVHPGISCLGVSRDDQAARRAVLEPGAVRSRMAPIAPLSRVAAADRVRPPSRRPPVP